MGGWVEMPKHIVMPFIKQKIYRNSRKC